MRIKQAAQAVVAKAKVLTKFMGGHDLTCCSVMNAATGQTVEGTAMFIRSTKGIVTQTGGSFAAKGKGMAYQLLNVRNKGLGLWYAFGSCRVNCQHLRQEVLG